VRTIFRKTKTMVDIDIELMVQVYVGWQNAILYAEYNVLEELADMHARGVLPTAHAPCTTLDTLRTTALGNALQELGKAQALHATLLEMQGKESHGVVFGTEDSARLGLENAFYHVVEDGYTLWASLLKAHVGTPTATWLEEIARIAESRLEMSC
jgi:hypothetical protein